MLKKRTSPEPFREDVMPETIRDDVFRVARTGRDVVAYEGRLTPECVTYASSDLGCAVSFGRQAKDDSDDESAGTAVRLPGFWMRRNPDKWAREMRARDAGDGDDILSHKEHVLSDDGKKLADLVGETMNSPVGLTGEWWRDYGDE